MSRCLVKNPGERADTDELLLHPFIKQVDHSDKPKDAYLYTLTEYFNSKLFKNKIIAQY